MRACQAQHRSIVCSFQGRLWYAMPDVVRPGVLSKGDDGMPRPTLLIYVCSTNARMEFPWLKSSDIMRCHMAMITCHDLRHSTMCAVQGPWWHATPDLVLQSVPSNGYVGMPHPTSSDYVCCLKAIMVCHARRRPNMNLFQGLLWHAPRGIVNLYVLSKGDDGTPCRTSLDSVCY